MSVGIRFTGLLLLLISALFTIAVMANLHVALRGGRNLQPLLIYVVIFVPLGLGLMRLRRWAAIVYAVLMTPLAIWAIVSSLMVVPWPWEALNLIFFGQILFPVYWIWRDRANLT
jgi:hypothetical protein